MDSLSNIKSIFQWTVELFILWDLRDVLKAPLFLPGNTISNGENLKSHSKH